MALKNYSVRLDEEEYEKLKKYLGEHGDPDLNIGFVLRQYIRDLNKAIPNLKRSDFDPRLILSLFGSMIRQIHRNASLANLMEDVTKGKKTAEK